MSVCEHSAFSSVIKNIASIDIVTMHDGVAQADGLASSPPLLVCVLEQLLQYALRMNSVTRFKRTGGQLTP